MESKKYLSICTWNSRGLTASIPYIRELVKSHDIVLISEHWLHSNRLNRFEDIDPDTAYFARASRASDADQYGSSRGEGGVAILWSKRLKGVTPMRDTIHDRICGIRVQIGVQTVLNIFSLYMPAKGCKGDLQTVLDEVTAIIEGTENGCINILGGDLNGDVGVAGGPKGTKIPTQEGRHVFNFAENLELSFVNLHAKSIGPTDTHYGPTGSSCLDYVLVPKHITDKVLSCTVLEEEALNTSDHYPVSVKIDVGSIELQVIEVNAARNVKWNKLSSETINDKYTKPVSAELTLLKEDMDQNPDNIFQIDQYIQRLVSILKSNEDNLPNSKFKPNVKPYWCHDLDVLKKEKVNCYRKWKEAGMPRDRDSALRKAHLSAKKNFMKKLRKMHREYENEQIEDVIRSAEVNKSHFWNLLKKSRSGGKVSISTIRDVNNTVASDPELILEVWRRHFDFLSTPQQSKHYDQAHFENVTRQVSEWFKASEKDEFLLEPISKREVTKGISKLHSGKVPGHDGVTKENLVAAGPVLTEVLVTIFNMIIQYEYVPVNFRRGIQIPLYKGKNAPPLDTNSYRGITLLSILNKLFEVLIWQRMEGWWNETQVISELQGACRKGVSCIHTAMLLQETIATELESHNKVFVAYYDVAKAFDGVWIDGLFFRLHEMGVVGKTWRILYKTYIDFKCRVRIQNLHSKWYNMECGIHQGGFLSLMKYTAFINSLLTELKDSGLCCTVHQIKTSPLGYADDVASAGTSKYKLDSAMKIVHNHSNRWRYQLNAKKCAVLVYGEGKRENARNKADRMYRLGSEKVVEKSVYDHVGLKNCTNDYGDRIDEKISKGRKALCASTGIGIKKGGISMKLCSFIYWTIIVPIITFASELWVLTDQDIDKLDKFHRYAGRKMQRFHNRSSVNTSYECLGWMRLENFIYAKKLLFVRTVATQESNKIYLQVFRARMAQFKSNIEIGVRNVFNSPVFDILRISIVYGLFDEVCRMIDGSAMFSKTQWKRVVWERAWQVEKDSWLHTRNLFDEGKMLSRIMGIPGYIVWWHLSDLNHDYMRRCEIMVKLICNVSMLKSDDFKLDGCHHSVRICDKCDNFTIEDANHVILQCNYTSEIRRMMFNEIEKLENGAGTVIIEETDDILATILGKICNKVTFESYVEFCKITCTYVSRMYWQCIKNRAGVG